MSAAANRLGQCNVCEKRPAKYTCPSCEARTCCLSCSKEHKEEVGCDGERRRITFRRRNQFTDLDFLSDYRLLEGIGRFIENCHGDPLKKVYSFKHRIPAHKHCFYQEVRSRGCRFYFMPEAFTRHKENTSDFDRKTKNIFWRIALWFPQADMLQLVETRVCETVKLNVVLKKYLDPNSSFNLDPVVQERLQFYQSRWPNGVEVLLQAEKIPGSKEKYYRLDLHSSVQSNLQGKCIIEYPRIAVILKDHLQTFDIIEQDDSDEKDLQTINKNFLFADSSSDDEDKFKTVSQPAAQLPGVYTTFPQRPRKQLNIPSYDQLVTK